MTLDIVLIQTVGVVLAASLPTLIGLLRMKRTALSIEEIRAQILPENGKRLAALAYETQRDVADVRNQVIDLKLEVRNHHHNHQNTGYAYTGGAASISAVHSHSHQVEPTPNMSLGGNTYSTKPTKKSTKGVQHTHVHNTQRKTEED